MSEPFKLSELELIGLRGIEARKQLLVAQVEKVNAEIDMDLATLYGTIETRLEIEAGSIVNGVCRIEDTLLIPTEAPKEVQE
jgi:hypothetical protein